MDIYQQRRQQLFAELAEDAVVIMSGNTEKVRNKNITYPFRQDNDFYYLTGFAEPDAVVVFCPSSEKPYTLFCQPKDTHQEVYFGARTGVDNAVADYGADQAFAIEELAQQMPGLIGASANIYLSDELGRFQSQVFDWLKNQRRGAAFDQFKVFPSLHSVLPHIHQKRIVKDESEIALLRHAIDASVVGHKALMRQCKPGMNEQQLAGLFYQQVSNFGCQDVGYPSIIAAGNNACCLHYTENNSPLIDGDMILIDAGGDFQYYTADITRTYPINGKFTTQQAELYQVVLDALDAAIARVQPGQSWNAMYPAAMAELVEGMLHLGIMSGSADEILEKQLHKVFSIHKTGHWLGLDVHDVGPYLHSGAQEANWLQLAPNMVFTIEPGLYFPQDCQDVAEKWRGMGVRIEDDILVTADGHENLSAAAPRTIEEIEKWMAG